MPIIPRRQRILLTTLLVCFIFLIQAQDFNRIYPQVIETGEELDMPWTGGLNAPQFSEIDLNDDGLKDLFVFDRIGNVVSTFIYSPSEGYQYAPEWIDRFPRLENWALLRDFDQDGIEDIFTYSFEPGAHSVKVYRGKRAADGLFFERMSFGFGPFDVLYFPGSGNFPINLLVTNIDIPAIDDIDGDNDLDILSFSLSGGLVEYYRNYSVEMGYGVDSLIFEKEDDCWGKFYESGFSNEVTLSPDPDRCAINLLTAPGQVRHAGSTLFTFDSDDDGDKELVLGDIASDFMVFLLNGGDQQEAYMVSQDTAYPSKTVSIDLPIFPAGFLIDIDHDGKDDLVVSPNNISSIEDTENVWYYRDNSSNDIPSFGFVQRDLIVGDMLEVGTGAQPAFTDVNGDGLMDLVIGNNTFYKEFGEKDSRLLLYLNTGSAGQPVFTLSDEDFLEFSAFSSGNNPSYYFAPAFGDLDGDGDEDLVVGERWGSLFYAENLAGAGNPMDFGPVQPNFLSDETFGQSITPQIIDLNRDGLSDLVIGERNGNLNYFQNIGEQGEPQFDPDVTSFPNTDRLGNVDTRKLGFFTGQSAPFFIEVGNEYKLLAGSESRGIIQYGNIEDNLYGDFELEVSEYLGDIYEGSNVRQALADIDNDGYLEMVVGNERGGLSMFNTPFSGGTTSVLNIPETRAIDIFPNPVHRDLYFVVSGKMKSQPVSITIFSRDGKRVMHRRNIYLNEPLQVGSLPDGFYIGMIQTTGETYHFRFARH